MTFTLKVADRGESEIFNADNAAGGEEVDKAIAGGGAVDGGVFEATADGEAVEEVEVGGEGKFGVATVMNGAAR